MNETINKLTDELAAEVVAKAGPKLLEYLRRQHEANEPDPLLNTKTAALHLDVSETTIRQLIALGHLQKAPGITDIRIRKSVLDAYGKSQPKKGKA